MKNPAPPAELATLLHVLRATADEVLHDYRQVYELGYTSAKRGDTGRGSGTADPTGALGANLFDGQATEDAGNGTRRPAWRHRQAQSALLDAEEKVRDATADLEAAKKALFRPFKERGGRDPIKQRPPAYDGALGKDERRHLERLARQRKARGEE